jgi:hypothetical protein
MEVILAMLARVEALPSLHFISRTRKRLVCLCSAICDSKLVEGVGLQLLDGWRRLRETRPVRPFACGHETPRSMGRRVWIEHASGIDSRDQSMGTPTNSTALHFAFEYYVPCNYRSEARSFLRAMAAECDFPQWHIASRRGRRDSPDGVMA